MISENSSEDIPNKSEAQETEENDIERLIKLRKKNIDRPIIAYYNINSLRNKIHDLRVVISRFLPDVIVLAETKVNQSLPNQQFLIEEYNEPTRRDRSEYGGGVIEYTRKGVIRKRLKNLEMKNFESITSEITIKKYKMVSTICL